MIWSSNNKWGSKLRQKQAPQNRSTARLLPPTWASAAESPGPKHQGQESPQESPSLPLGLPKGPEHGATARQWPCEPSAPQRVNLQALALGLGPLAPMALLPDPKTKKTPGYVRATAGAIAAEEK